MPARRGLPLGAVLFFLALAFHPLPDVAALARLCPLPGAEPNLVPLGFVRDTLQAWRDRTDLEGFLRHNPLYSAGMNFALCVLIGRLWRPARPGWTVLGGGFALSLAIELTQLSGFWGLYPCAYRKFDVDDLLLNTLGVALGAYLRH